MITIFIILDFLINSLNLSTFIQVSESNCISKAALQSHGLIEQLRGLLPWMLHNTKCVSAIDNISERGLTFCWLFTMQGSVSHTTIEFLSWLKGLMWPQPVAVFSTKHHSLINVTFSCPKQTLNCHGYFWSHKSLTSAEKIKDNLEVSTSTVSWWLGNGVWYF